MFEINLVPDVKAEMIRAQKKRNVVFFAAAAVSAIAAGVVILLMTVKFGLDARIGAQDKQLSLMSNTIKKYDGLEDLLTVQKQLSDLKTLGDSKTMLSRVFTVLHSMVQTENGDEIDISTMDVNLTSSEISFEGHTKAGAGTDGINYRVLESFTKTLKLMKYDYGRYVDANGEVIPTMCIFESNSQGVPYQDANGNVYAVWAKGVAGCDPSNTEDESETVMLQTETLTVPTDESGTGADTTTDSGTSSNTTLAMRLEDVDLSQGCDDSKLVCIYRTPQFTDWYRRGYMTADGTISKKEHFESQCITYNSTEENGTLRWSSENSCDMAPEGIDITSSSDAKTSGGELVLSFSAILYMNPEVFNFSNKHMITIAPSGRQNVTDSFIQVGDMFAEKAKAIEKE